MDITNLLQQYGIRATPVRTLLLKILQTSLRPMSVPELENNQDIKKFGADPVTLYRTLETFCNAGMVKRIELQEGKFRYELNVGTHHHHILCTQCGKIADVTNCLEKGITEKIEKRTQFSIVDHSLEFFGLCPTCKTA